MSKLLNINNAKISTNSINGYQIIGEVTSISDFCAHLKNPDYQMGTVEFNNTSAGSYTLNIQCYYVMIRWWVSGYTTVLLFGAWNDEIYRLRLNISTGSLTNITRIAVA